MPSLAAYHPQFFQKEYAGLTAFMSGVDRPLQDDIEADIEGEQETLPDLLDDDINPPPELDDGMSTPITDIPANNPSRLQMEQTVAGFSKGVTNTTETGYLRLAEACVAFLISKNLIKTQSEFISATPLPSTPFLIIVWIMNECKVERRRQVREQLLQ
ncbi:hypothetical protein HYPSUDRAFT_59881 [Hypholoma sublateritium FD-334 SS-4]|uniref:Uncharacterized protein n=1 Tax=Hypholoma sublateritium (strain FD-334 SS-4) TaxID=945553 RepID=A0A0D2NYD0_HYPSF|nr:hypothetical protein HYPSUDRAFT_59881 [Hypholoma sublateritium FD-334 SS-4]